VPVLGISATLKTKGEIGKFVKSPVF